ncbi:MAG: hypothetical protein LBC85_05765 [Fibromonadaceae bacterium]|jgi:hypothetical protein|nr:hypothetical protein [Fibromonadaceae bacterium]
MKALALVAALFLFVGCSSDGGGGGNNSDVKVPTSGKTLEQLLGDAVESLKKGQWDEAIAYYNAAYDRDNNSAEAIIYSTLANLAKISTDPKVVALIKDNLGFTKYPNRLNALFSTDWMQETPNYIQRSYFDESSREWVYWYNERDVQWYDEINRVGYWTRDYKFVSSTPKYSSVFLPAIKTPNWLKGNGSAYNEALLSGNVFSVDNWALSLLANVIDKNSNGFNKLMDDIIDGVFGLSYNAAVERLGKLENRKEDRIRLNSYFIDEFGLGSIFDEHDLIGWAEVNAVLSVMLANKASLEWVAAYDLNTDLNWLKYAWKNDADDMLNQFKKVDARNLPFNNNFLKARTGRMQNAKDSYIKAIQGMQASYASIQNSDIYPKEVKEAFSTINDGFGKLIIAIQNDGKFYIPEDPTKGSWPTNGNNAVAFIDLGILFTPGYFSLQNMFETDNGKPVFYSRSRYRNSYTKLDKSTVVP